MSRAYARARGWVDGQGVGRPGLTPSHAMNRIGARSSIREEGLSKRGLFGRPDEFSRALARDPCTGRRSLSPACPRSGPGPHPAPSWRPARPPAWARVGLQPGSRGGQRANIAPAMTPQFAGVGPFSGDDAHAANAGRAMSHRRIFRIMQEIVVWCRIQHPCRVGEPCGRRPLVATVPIHRSKSRANGTTHSLQNSTRNIIILR